MPFQLTKLPPLTQPNFTLAQALWLRILGVIYITAFGALWPQIVGLIGARGISPAAEFIASVRAAIGSKAFLEVPSLFWFGISDTALVTFCALGCVGGLLLAAGFFSRTAAAICFTLYLSIVVVGQPFTNFQWDALLLEAGFLALFAGTPLVSLAYRFLLFRLMFESGVVKLTSHDPNWRNLHALHFHFMTQPLPTPLAYYALRGPGWVLDSCTLATFAIEFGAPFLLFATRRLRHVGAGLIIGLQLIIAVTGNYAFFNLLTIALCLWAFDESVFTRLAYLLRPRVRAVQNRVLNVAASTALIVLILVGTTQVLSPVFTPSEMDPVAGVMNSISRFEIVNSYGLFAVMTTTRPEVILEGSNDGRTWREYQFRYKPGDLHRGLPVVAPYHPRLDWQMWFAALGSYQENTWAGGLMYRLLTNEKTVANLLEAPPFPAPPRYIRALLYDYTFTTPAERSRTGNVWERKLLRIWFGPVSLRATNSTN